MLVVAAPAQKKAKKTKKAAKTEAVQPKVDTVSVDVSVESFNGLIMTILYEMRNQKDEILCEGRSEHVFINSAGRLIRLNKEQPEFCRAIESEIRDPEPEDNLKETSENS